MKNLSDNHDAQVWAEEFIKAVKENPAIATDEGAMTSWFANAIMAGYDEARRKYEVVNLHSYVMASINDDPSAWPIWIGEDK